MFWAIEAVKKINLIPILEIAVIEIIKFILIPNTNWYSLELIDPFQPSKGEGSYITFVFGKITAILNWFLKHIMKELGEGSDWVIYLCSYKITAIPELNLKAHSRIIKLIGE
jgi:hypothetical protein